jgi:SAM-dependent methyltransferase
MIHSIPHAISEGLRKENEAHAESLSRLDFAEMQNKYPRAESYVQEYLGTSEGKQFAQAVENLPAGSKILDIGAGYGRSTIFLASRGYQVRVLEPAPALCDFINGLAEFYGYALTIYQAPAEAINRLPETDFDACIFNASLHHCDDPVTALTHCHRVLLPGGFLFILNEPQLQFFRSKIWFRRQLEQGTFVAGDYGGNEHIYYYHEYQHMLRQAGFVRIQNTISNRYRDSASYLRSLRVQGNTLRTILVRKIYYRVVRILQCSGFLGRGLLTLLREMSLVQSYFTACRS